MPFIVALHPATEEHLAWFAEEHDQQTQAITNVALRYHYAKLEAVYAIHAP